MRHCEGIATLQRRAIALAWIGIVLTGSFMAASNTSLAEPGATVLAAMGATVLFGTPVAWLGWRWLTTQGNPCSRADSRPSRWGPLAVSLTLAACVWWQRGGTPVGAVTLLVLAAGPAWCLLWTCYGPQRRHALAWTCLFCLPLLAALADHGTTMFDLSRGRKATAVVPCGLMLHGVDHPLLGLLLFEQSGNRAILDEYLGPNSPCWVPISDPYNVRSHVERIDHYSLVFDPELRRILSLLPSNEARRQVLTCLTDPHNLVRAHQGLLLKYLDVLGYPPGFDRESWWHRHADLFGRVNERKEAARLVWGWRARSDPYVPWSRDCPASWHISRHHVAARRAEFDQPACRDGFLEALAILDFELGGKTDRTGYNLGIDRIAWWPERPCQEGH